MTFPPFRSFIRLACLFLLFALPLSFAKAQDNFGDRLKGLVFEAEEWSEPKDAWLVDRGAETKWTLWTTEEDVWKKRSKGKSLKTPVVKKDRETPEEGAPPLHTRITGIPKGSYKVFMNHTNRRLGLSFDGGKTWESSRLQGEEYLGFYSIDDGVFELWVDDRYATPESFGPAYYDYIRFEATEPLAVFATEPVSFTLTDGSTQLSWISSVPLPAAVVRCSDENGKTYEFKEEDDGMRNHRVVLHDLKPGTKYIATVAAPLNRAGQCCDRTVAFVAGQRPTPPATVVKKIKLTVSESTKSGRTKGYVSSGVPFAQGTLAGPDDVALQNENGEPVDAQFDVMSRWADGSVQWLLCDFVTTTNPEKPAVYYLATAPNAGRKNVAKKKDVDEKRIEKALKRFASEIVLGDGTKLVWKPETNIEYETVGDLRTSVRCAGDYVKPDGTSFFRGRVHLSFFGNDYLRVRWALCNDKETADHSIVRSACVSTDLPKQEPARLAGGKTAAKSVSVLQDRVDHALVNLDGREETAKQFDGFLQIGKLGCWMRDFWETWPKGMSYENNHFRFDILPALPSQNYPPENWTTLDETFMHYYWFKDGCYQFKRGMELQTELWFVLDEKTLENPDTCAEHLAKPLFAVAEPAVYCESGVFPPINPRREGVFDSYEKAFETSFAELEKGRLQRNEYGWMNFGDWFGERRWNWGNNEYDLSYVCAMHFARSGNLDFLNRGVEMARHYSTIDVNWSPRQPRTRELVYAHSTGHVGGFVQKDDPRLADQKKFVANLVGTPDSSGGHCHQPGNFYLACLTGDKRFFEVAETVCMNQAKYYTPNFNFSIERAAGWPLTNAMAAYRFTGNPYYLNAADLYFETISSKQNKETGCFDLPQDGSECDCPDKKEHRGGKAFATGVLMHGLARYYEATQKPEAKTCLVRCADWLIDISWNESVKGFRYKTGCPKYADSGWYAVLVTEGVATAGELTGNPRYTDFLARTLGRELGKSSGSSVGCGKEFSQRFRQIPHALYYLEKHGHRTLEVGK